MKFFGEFLIEHNLIDRHQLLAALVRQVRDLPSYAEVVFEQNLLPEETLFEAFKLQTIRKISFLEACIEMKVWNQQLNETIHEEVRKKRVPIGQILLEMKALDLDTLTRALDEFLGAAAPAEQGGKAPETGASGLLSTDSFPPLLAAFSQGRLKGLPPELLQNSRNELHALRGHTRLKGAETLEKLIVEIEPVLEKMKLKAKAEIPDDLFQKASRLLAAAFEITVQLALEVESGAKGYLEAPEKMKLYQQCLDELPVLCFDLDFL
ncbi:MAG: hypothetical protein ACXVB9_05935 [Bdellovibrionota bacterium]